MKTVPTSSLSDAALDFAVAKANGLMMGQIAIDGVKMGFYKPSRDWSQGGPIIEREGIELLCESLGFRWVAIPQKGPEWRGPTPLIAAMRCYVASKLGVEVEIPDELH